MHDAQRTSAAGARVARISQWRPRCDQCGRPVPVGTTRPPLRYRGQLHVSWRCPGCGRVSQYPATPVHKPVKEGIDPWFGLPLVLRTSVGRHLLWAWNAHHLLLLEEWLGATLRERSHRPSRSSLASRLPGWIQTAAMRPKAMKAIAELRTLALAEGIT